MQLLKVALLLISKRRGYQVEARSVPAAADRWTEEDKGRIVAESFERGVKASDVARRHDLSPQQLFQRRRQGRRGGLVVPMADEMTFAGPVRSRAKMLVCGLTADLVGREAAGAGRISR
jgi:transposase-like protein